MPIRTTAGQLKANMALPADLRDYTRVLDKKGLETLLREVAQRHPDQYVDVSKKLSDIGRFHAQSTGGYSFDLEHMRKSPTAQRIQAKLDTQIQRVLHAGLSPETRKKKIIELTSAAQQQQNSEVYDEGIAAKNPLAMQIHSGARGNKANYNSLVGGDLQYNDNQDNPLLLPVYRSYSQGLSYPEYHASLFGARKGVVDVKLGVANAGYYNKLLNQVSHRNVVVDTDVSDDDEHVKDRKQYLRGLPVDVSDKGSVGALLARDTGPFKANTVITQKILDSLDRGGHKKLVVRSPIARSSPDGGVYAYDVGLDENGHLVQRGDMPGMTTSQGVSEPVTQMGLNSKHTGGVAGQVAVSGFKSFEQMAQIPSTFQGGAAHAVADGTVQRIQKAPAGGSYVWVGSNRHYVAPEQAATVKVGDSVEAGDTLSNGIPNPEKITMHKGIGEGRRYWTNTMMDLAKSQNMRADRRNLELISRGLINHVRLNDFVGDYIPDDVVPYHMIEAAYEPREGGQRLHPKKAIGKYLESPILHHTIGVKVTPKMAKEMDDLKLDEVHVHDQPPPFNFEMVRASDNLLHDPDPITRMYGSNLSKGLLASVHRGAVSDRTGTSFVPSLAHAADFGREGYFQHKSKPVELPPEGKPLPKVASDTHDPDTSRDTDTHYLVTHGGKEHWYKGPRPQYHYCEGCRKPCHGPRSMGAVPVYDIPSSECKNCTPGYKDSFDKAFDKTADFEPDPSRSQISPLDPVKPPEVPWEKPPGQGQHNPYSAGAPKNNMPKPGFNSSNQYTPMAGMAAHQAQQPQQGQSPFPAPQLPPQMRPQYQQPGLEQYGVQHQWGPPRQQPQQQIEQYPEHESAAEQPPADFAQAPEGNSTTNWIGNQIAQNGTQVAVGRSLGKTLGPKSMIRGGAMGGVGGSTAGMIYDLAAGNPLETKDVVENTLEGAISGVAPLGAGMIAAPALVDAGKNLLGTVSQEDINNRAQQLEQSSPALGTPDSGLTRAKGMLGAAMTPVTSARAAAQISGQHDQYVKGVQDSTNFSKQYFERKTDEALNNPDVAEAQKQVMRNNRGKADMELSEFRTNLATKARPNDFADVEKEVGDKLQQRADIRSQLQMSDSGQNPLPQAEYAKLQGQLIDINKVVKSTEQELTNPSSFSASTLSKALLRDADVEKSPNSQEYVQRLNQAPENLEWGQFHALAKMKSYHSERAQLDKQLAATPNDPKLLARQQELNTKIEDEKKAVKS